VAPPDDTDDWLGLCAEPFDVGAVYAWTVRPGCGAVVLFSGTVRDHAADRPSVIALTYEAYEEQVARRLGAIVAELRDRWPTVGRVALLHRVGRLAVGESSVLAVVSAPHRPEAFEAARHAIDTLKATVPIWKYEEWEGGADWGTDAQVLPADAQFRVQA
jgi:molybdopterin synthase catalytic subunit